MESVLKALINNSALWNDARYTESQMWKPKKVWHWMCSLAIVGVAGVDGESVQK